MSEPAGGNGSLVGNGPLLADGHDQITFGDLPTGACGCRLSPSGERIENLPASPAIPALSLVGLALPRWTGGSGA